MAYLVSPNSAIEMAPLDDVLMWSPGNLSPVPIPAAFAETHTMPRDGTWCNGQTYSDAPLSQR